MGLRTSPVGIVTFLVVPALVWSAAMTPAARGEDALQGGVAMIPKDAAFVSASLRLEEQAKAVLGSRAVDSIRRLPPVAQLLAQLEEQKMQPGSPLSMVDTYMQLPENQQLLELLRDMVATDTFLYGEPSCITFLELIQKVQRAQNAANFLTMARGGPLSIDVEVDVEEMDDDGAAAPGGARIVPVRRQVAELDDIRIGSSVDNELTARMVLQALADNSDKIVVPDLVWGFKTGKRDAALSQLKRLEVLLKLVTQTQPALADAVTRRSIGGGEIVTFTVDGGMIPWNAILREQEGMNEADLDKVRRALGELDLAISFGLVGDRVILSIGDSSAHLEKLVADGKAGLASTEPFVPLREHKDEKITSITYVSEALAKAVAPSAADLEQLAELSDTLADAANLPEGAAREARAMLEKMAAGYTRRLPVPGPSLGYSFLTGDGYEGYAWDWSKNGTIDGSKPLDLLANTGGNPVASLVLRTKPQPGQFEDFVSWGSMAWDFARKYLAPKADAEARERMEAVESRFRPLVERLVATMRTKFLPSLADGQVGFVIDAKGRTTRLQRDVPSSVEPLPLAETAVALRLSDAKLFREALSDVFELADDVVAAMRALEPGSVPEGYRIPEPVRSKVDGGALWTFPLTGSGIDEQFQPAIGVSDATAVFSLAPKQAERMLVSAEQRTAESVARFDGPLAGAAALDFVGLVDLVEPWVVYGMRVASAQQRNGFADAGTEVGPDLDDGQMKDAMDAVRVVFDCLRCIRMAAAETTTRPDATVTHWRNLIRDLPAESE